MSVTGTLQSINNDVEAFWQRAKDDAKVARVLWSIIASPQTRAIMTRLTRDAINLTKDAAGAITASGLNLNLDVALVEDIQALVSDAEQDGVIAGDLKAIGVVL